MRPQSQIKKTNDKVLVKSQKMLTGLDCVDFDNPEGSLKGIIAAAYSLGAIMSLPFIPIVNDKFGRRWSIFGGSLIMVIGALIQGFSQHGELHSLPVYQTHYFTSYCRVFE